MDSEIYVFLRLRCRIFGAKFCGYHWKKLLELLLYKQLTLSIYSRIKKLKKWCSQENNSGNNNPHTKQNF